MSQIGKKMTDDNMRITVDLEEFPDWVETYEDAAVFLLNKLSNTNRAVSLILQSLSASGDIHEHVAVEWLAGSLLKHQFFADQMKDYRVDDEKKPDKPAGDVVDIKTKH